MRLSKARLKQIIKEEIGKAINEEDGREQTFNFRATLLSAHGESLRPLFYVINVPASQTHMVGPAGHKRRRPKPGVMEKFGWDTHDHGVKLMDGPPPKDHLPVHDLAQQRLPGF